MFLKMKRRLPAMTVFCALLLAAFFATGGGAVSGNLRTIVGQFLLKPYSRRALVLGDRRERPVHFRERLQRRLHTRHRTAIELDLVAYKPGQGSRNTSLGTLDCRVDDTSRPRVDATDRGDLRLSGIARVQQRHEIRGRDAIDRKRLAFAACAGLVLDAAYRRAQLFVSHFLVPRFHCAVTLVPIPPRGVKSPTTSAHIGLVALTTSARNRLTIFS